MEPARGRVGMENLHEEGPGNRGLSNGASNSVQYESHTVRTRAPTGIRQHWPTWGKTRRGPERGKKNLDKKKLSTLETSLNGTLAHLTG